MDGSLHTQNFGRMELLDRSEFFTPLGKLPRIVRMAGGGVLHAAGELEGDKTASGLTLPFSELSFSRKISLLAGRHEAAERRVLLEMLEPHDIAADIGAADGYMSAVIGTSLHSREVALVEARPDLFQKALRTCALNGVKVFAKQAAIAEEGGTHTFYACKHGLRSSLFRPENGDAYTTINVDGIRLEEFLKNVPGVTLLHIDIEGAETLIDWQALPQSVTKIAMELHPHVYGDMALEICARLQTAGFEARWRAKESDVIGFVR